MKYLACSADGLWSAPAEVPGLPALAAAVAAAIAPVTPGNWSDRLGLALLRPDGGNGEFAADGKGNAKPIEDNDVCGAVLSLLMVRRSACCNADIAPYQLVVSIDAVDKLATPPNDTKLLLASG